MTGDVIPGFCTINPREHVSGYFYHLTLNAPLSPSKFRWIRNFFNERRDPSGFKSPRTTIHNLEQNWLERLPKDIKNVDILCLNFFKTTNKHFWRSGGPSLISKLSPSWITIPCAISWGAGREEKRNKFVNVPTFLSMVEALCFG